MIRRLTIRNYALIKELEISPSAGLNIITGETGAGKSIMLGALGLLLGERADTKALYESDTKCVVEAEFEVSAYQLEALFEELDLDYEPVSLLRREISPSGKSRAFINDTPVKLPQIKQIGQRLLDIHSQHDTLQLGTNAYQLDLLDRFAGHSSLIADYQQAYRAYTQAQKALAQIKASQQAARAEFEFNQFQLEELEKAQLDGLDQEALEQEQEKLQHAEQIKASLQTALQAISGAEESAESAIKRAAAALQSIARFAPDYEKLRERAQSLLIEVNDLVFEMEREDSSLEVDTERTDALDAILSDLFTLQQKHQRENVRELIALRDELRQKVEQVLHSDEALEAAQQALSQAEAQVHEKGQKLTQSREKALPKLEKQITALLKDLGMPNGRLLIRREAQPPAPQGLDLVSFLFSANKGIEPAPLKQVASGGEFSRLMLALKYVMAQKSAMPTVIFDEIDTGISGEIAIKVGKLMQEMAHRHQLVAISHLPQIAAKGQTHYFVYKGEEKNRTVSRIRPLSPEERLQEIAQMIGGAKPSTTAIQSAKELIEEV